MRNDMGRTTSTARRSIVGAFAALATALGLLLFAAPVAGAAPDCNISRFTNPDGSTDLTGYLQCSGPSLSQTTVAPGDTITFSGGGFKGGSEITITVYSTPQVLGTTVADASGNFSVQVTLPSNLDPGAHRLEASGVDPSGSPLTVSLDFTVVSAGQTSEAGAVTPSGSLPYTGSDVGRIVGVGLAAVVVGGAAVWGARRAKAGRTAA